jgi:hypothetical protein
MLLEPRLHLAEGVEGLAQLRLIDGVDIVILDSAMARRRGRTPDIVEAILYGKHSLEITLATLMSPFQIEWARQRLLWHQRQQR